MTNDNPVQSPDDNSERRNTSAEWQEKIGTEGMR